MLLPVTQGLDLPQYFRTSGFCPAWMSLQSKTDGIPKVACRRVPPSRDAVGHGRACPGTFAGPHRSPWKPM